MATTKNEKPNEVVETSSGTSVVEKKKTTMPKKKSSPKKKPNKTQSNKMTLKQKRFCDEYILTGNQTQAAINAGYKKSSAKEIASENLTKPNIVEYIAKRLEELDEKSIMKQKEVVQRLTKIGRREESETIVVTVKTKRIFYEDGKKITEEFEEPKLVEIPSKLSDTNKSLELLGKFYNIFKDNLQVDATITDKNKLSDILTAVRKHNEEEGEDDGLEVSTFSEVPGLPDDSESS